MLTKSIAGLGDSVGAVPPPASSTGAGAFRGRIGVAVNKLAAICLLLLSACDISGLDAERAALLEENLHLKQSITAAERLLFEIEKREAQATLAYARWVLHRLGLL